MASLGIDARVLICKYTKIQRQRS